MTFTVGPMTPSTEAKVRGLVARIDAERLVVGPPQDKVGDPWLDNRKLFKVFAHDYSGRPNAWLRFSDGMILDRTISRRPRT